MFKDVGKVGERLAAVHALERWIAYADLVLHVEIDGLKVDVGRYLRAPISS